MKKSFILFLLAVFALSGVVLSNPTSTYAKTHVPPGSIIKGKSLSTLYYIGEDGRRYVFPNSQTFFSWSNDFNEVIEIEDDELADYLLGGNVRYRPGVLLVKIQSDPRVYAVGNNGELRWVKTEALAIALYGKNWNKLIDDVPDAFFVNYEVGDDIDEEEDFDPTEEEESSPTPSHNRGLKQRLKAIHDNRATGLCRLLENNLNTLQNRLERLGLELPDVGDELLEMCYAGADDSSTEKKVAICHKETDSLSIGSPAARAHFAHGDKAGDCDDDEVTAEGDTENEDEEGDVEEDENDDDENDDDVVLDETAPLMTNFSTTVSASSTVITWSTDELATSELTYALTSLETATNTSVVEHTDLVTSHSFELFGLLFETEYFFSANSTDEAGNESESATGTFTTETE